MIQHTMQEIADFIGKNVAKDKNGSVYVFGSIPHKQSTFWFGSNYCNITDVVSDAAAHDWTVLVEPHHNPNNCAHQLPDFRCELGGGCPNLTKTTDCKDWKQK